MKALIIDDMKFKQNEVIFSLKKVGIEEYEIAESIRDALLLLKNNKFDIIITDLGLPRFKDHPVENPLAGFEMLTELALCKIFIPTIVYSTTKIPRDDLIDLRDVFEYPYLGQAIDIETLCLLLQIFIEDNKKNANFQTVRARTNKNSITDSN